MVIELEVKRILDVIKSKFIKMRNEAQGDDLLIVRRGKGQHLNSDKQNNNKK